MTLEEFKASLAEEKPPERVSLSLQALWQDAKGNWDEAHQLAQSVSDSRGAWVHAYLHRKEGDFANAGYWYSRAGKNRPRNTLEDEWELIADALLKL